MKRGEIWAVAGGVYATKPTPAIVLQDDVFDLTDSITVCPMTSTDVDAPLMRLEIAADATTRLDSASFVMIDKITTVRRSQVVQRIGRVSSTQLVDLERLVMVFLGLAD
jgi:mRNA interferase MazF